MGDESRCRFNILSDGASLVIVYRIANFRFAFASLQHKSAKFFEGQISGLYQSTPRVHKSYGLDQIAFGHCFNIRLAGQPKDKPLSLIEPLIDFGEAVLRHVWHF
jgi:hypothetical protein